MVPRVLGQTAIAEQKKSSKAGKSAPISETEFLKTLEASTGQSEFQAATHIIAWAKQLSLGQNFNKRQVVSSYTPYVEQVDGYRYPISVQSAGKVYIQMRWLRSCFPFQEENKPHQLWQKLNAVPGVNVSQDSMTGYPGITLQTLANDDSLRMFLDTMTWVVEELRAAEESQPPSDSTKPSSPPTAWETAMSDDDLLAALLKLNLERAGADDVTFSRPGHDCR